MGRKGEEKNRRKKKRELKVEAACSAVRVGMISSLILRHVSEAVMKGTGDSCKRGVGIGIMEEDEEEHRAIFLSISGTHTHSLSHSLSESIKQTQSDALALAISCLTAHNRHALSLCRAFCAPSACETLAHAFSFFPCFRCI